MELWEVTDTKFPNVYFKMKLRKNHTKKRQGGTLKVALLKVYSEVQGLLALSYYDRKPFYMMTNAIDKVQWIKKKRKVFRKYLQRTSEITSHFVNVIDMYNYSMNNVDVTYQLRGSYRFDHYRRKRRWWWYMFFCFFSSSSN